MSSASVVDSNNKLICTLNAGQANFHAIAVMISDALNASSRLSAEPERKASQTVSPLQERTKCPQCGSRIVNGTLNGRPVVGCIRMSCDWMEEGAE